jgi:sirohydrochlorin cobaltochelatase
MNSAAIVLVAHGSRDPAWAEPFNDLRARLQETLSVPVVLGFLELAEPSFESALLQVTSEERALVVPLFWSLGAHTRRDLPQRAEAFAKEHPALQLELMPPVGERGDFRDAVAEILATALRQSLVGSA